MKTGRKSIYGKEINAINISEIISESLDNILELNNYEWGIVLNSDWTELLAKTIANINFWNLETITDYGTYWCGVLTAEPFDSLERFGEEEDILNLIKNHHFHLVTTDNVLELKFKNPTSSPLYRFFNKHKEDGYGGNVPYSVNVLLNKIENFIKMELSNNILKYGELESTLVDDEEEIA